MTLILILTVDEYFEIWIATWLTGGSSEKEAGCHDPGVAGSAGHHGHGQSKVTQRIFLIFK
jgi:hypothetical protein